MNRIKAFGAFWYDFVIGDDWHVAALVVAGLALTAICVHVAGVNAWWLLPLFAFAALAWSLHKATKPSKSLSRWFPGGGWSPGERCVGPVSARAARFFGCAGRFPAHAARSSCPPVLPPAFSPPSPVKSVRSQRFPPV